MHLSVLRTDDDLGAGASGRATRVVGALIRGDGAEAGREGRGEHGCARGSELIAGGAQVPEPEHAHGRGGGHADEHDDGRQQRHERQSQLPEASGQQAGHGLP